MSRSALEKLRKRMALTAYFRDFFGVDDPNDPDSVRQYYEELDNQEEGYDDEGRSDVYRFVSFKSDSEVLTPEQLLQYDENVRMHTEALNERRSDPITLKPFQVLACLMTEAYLDRVVNNREAFLLQPQRVCQRAERGKRTDQVPRVRRQRPRQTGILDGNGQWEDTAHAYQLLPVSRLCRGLGRPS